jgi:hypothetical protein
MMRTAFTAPAAPRLAAAVLLLAAVVASSMASAATPGEHPVVGRFSITSDVGGAVWTFQPGGTLVIIGPGEIVSKGSWTPASGEHEFDASVDVEVTGQRLDVLGEVSPDGARVAIHVSASEAERPDDWTPWPAGSRLVGERFGMTPEPAPSPTPVPADCARPDWVDGAIDWDRCDATLLTEA